MDTQASQQQERVRDTVRDRLKKSCEYHWRFSHVRVHFADGVLLLEGVLPSYYLKQKLQTCLRGIDGVAWIRNEVVVVGAVDSSNGSRSMRRRARAVD